MEEFSCLFSLVFPFLLSFCLLPAGQLFYQESYSVSAIKINHVGDVKACKCNWVFLKTHDCSLNSAPTAIFLCQPNTTPSDFHGLAVSLVLQVRLCSSVRS